VPYFKWRAIDLSGNIIKGTTRALSVQELDKQLHEHDVALLHAKRYHHWSFFYPITTKLKITFFHHCALLLEAGIFLDDALMLMQQQCHHKAFRDVIDDIHTSIARGTSLAEALALYPSLFDATTLLLVQTSQQAGNVAHTLTIIADHHEAREQFYKKIKNAALMPCVTLVFFLMISITLMIFVVPFFVNMFDSLGKPMPASTAWLLWLHSFFTWQAFLLLSFLSIAIFWFIKKIYYAAPTKKYFDSMILKIPLIGSVAQESMMMYMFQSLALSLRAGIPLAQGWQSLIESTRNDSMKQKLLLVYDYLNQGNNFSFSLRQIPGLVREEMYALIAVGQESGNLSCVLEKAAHMYKDRLQRTLATISVMVQPLLMLVIAALVVMLIMAVYMPILNISYAIT